MSFPPIRPAVARLVVERENGNAIVFPAALLDRAAKDSEIESMLRGERARYLKVDARPICLDVHN